MILIDANSICHQCKHAMSDLSWHEKKVGVIFGFLRQILTLSKLFDTNEFAFAWDSRKSKRKEIFPDYKKARRHEKTLEEEELDTIAYRQFDLLRKTILPNLGFKNNFRQTGYEADDVIASIVNSNPTRGIAIISTDEDLYQLLSERVSLYSIRKKQFYTHKNLWKEYHVTPERWADVKAIAGCSTDGIPGIPRVGEKTACKYLNRTLGPSYKTFQSIRTNNSIIERNRRLVKLPFEGTPPFPVTFPDKLSFDNFLDICDEYGFRSFSEGDTLRKWKETVFFKRSNNG